MLSLRPIIFGLFFLSPVLLEGQCLTVDEIRQELADSTLVVENYVEKFPGDCPTAMDSLGPALYSRTLFYNGLGRPDEAIRYGILTLEALQQADTTLQLGKMAYNLGFIHSNLGDIRGAINYFRQAAATFPKIDHPQSQRRYLQSLIDLGYNYGLLGDFQLAEEALLRAQREAGQAENAQMEAFASVKLGDLYLANDQPGAAAGALEVAIAGFRTEGLTDWLNNTRISRVLLYRRQGKTAAALAEIKSLLAASGQLDRWNTARLYNTGLLIGLDNNDLQTAEAFFEKAIAAEAGSETRDPVLLSQAWDNGGEISLVKNDGEQAIERFGNAIAAVTPGFELSSETTVPTFGQLAESPYKVRLLTFIGGLARAYSAAGRPEDAIAALRAADVLADQLRKGLGGEVSALMWRERVLPLYEHAIKLSHDLGRMEDAFYFFEKSRAVLLLEAIAGNDLRGNLPPAAARRLVSAEKRLRNAQSELLAGGKDNLKAALGAARQQLLDLREELAASYPRAFPPVSLEVVDQAAARGNLTAAGFDMQLQYFAGEERTYLFVLSPSEARTVDLGPTEALEQTLRPLLGYFADPKAFDADPAGYAAAANTAYVSYFAPAAPPEGAALLILPDGLLSYVPFAALITGPDNEEPYLLQRNPTAYAQSSTLFGREWNNPPGEALSFTPFTEPMAGQNEPVLAFSADEAAALQDFYAAHQLNGTAASRAALLDTAGHYGILHLATHAWATRDGKAAPRILTADAPVYLPDVYGMHLNGALVTLSACRSNVGQMVRGEGVLGLGRAFRAAGAGGVVASLWSLNDRTTANLTTAFYERLAAGDTKPMALHHAQHNFLTRDDLPAYLKSPYYWAGLTYYGDAGTVAPPAKTGFWLWAVAAGLLLSIAGLLWRRFA